MAMKSFLVLVLLVEAVALSVHKPEEVELRAIFQDEGLAHDIENPDEALYDAEDWEAEMVRHQTHRQNHVPLPCQAQMASKNEICKMTKSNGNKSFPTFYVLGAQKAASSSLQKTLTEGGLIRPGPKELRSLTHMRHQFPGRYPDCGTSKYPRTYGFGVFADGTPTYFADPKAPGRLHEEYGKNLVSRLKFAVILREPMSRLNSAYHYLDMMNHEFKACCVYIKDVDGHEYKEPNFTGFLNKSMEKYASGKIPDGIQQSLYGKGLKAWLAKFHPSQFVVIPVKQYNRNVGRVMYDIADHLGMDCPLDSIQHFGLNNVKPMRHKNANGYDRPSLELDLADAGKELAGSVGQIFKDDTDLLSETLASAMKKGLKLSGYDGKQGSPVEILNWLKLWW